MYMINLKETCRMIQDYKAERDYIIKVKNKLSEEVKFTLNGR